MESETRHRDKTVEIIRNFDRSAVHQSYYTLRCLGRTALAQGGSRTYTRSG